MRKHSFRANVCVQCAYSQATAWRRQDVDALDVIVVDALDSALELQSSWTWIGPRSGK